MNILIYSKVGGFAEIIRNFYNVKQFYGCTLSLFSVVEAGKFPLQQYCRCDGCCKTDTLEGGGVAVAEEGVLEQ